MANDPSLRVRISADINDIKQGLAIVRGEVARFKSEAEKSIDLKGLNASLNGFANMVRGALAGITVGSVLRAVIGETRDATDEMAQLRAVVESTGQAAGYSASELQKMAQTLSASTTHSDGDIVRAQTRLLSYTGIVGETFPAALQMVIDQSARLGESIEQSAETIGKALDKPSQGVTALTKQGFKFTEQQKQQMKVLEQSGRTAEAQKIVLDAMAESYAGAAAAARGTFGGAITSVGNALRELFDGSGGGGINGVTRAINQLDDALRSPEIKQGFERLATSVLRTVEGIARFMAQDGVRYLRMLADAAAFAVKHIDLLAVGVGSYLAGRAITAAITGIVGLIRMLRLMQVALAGSTLAANRLKASLATMGGPVTLAITVLTTVLYELYQRTDEAKEAQEEHARALKEVGDMAKYARDQAFEVAKAKREEALATMAAAKAQLQAAQINARENVDAGRGGGNLLGLQSSSRASMNPSLVKAEADMALAQKMLDEWDEKMFELLTTGIDSMLKPIDAATGETGKAIAKSNALLIDSIRRSLAELDQLYERHGMSMEDYFSRRTALQQKSIDLEIDQARAELALATEAGARRKIEEQITVLQRDRADAATRAAAEQKKAEEDLSKALGEVKIRLLELDGEAARAERVKLEEQYKDLFARLDAESDAAGRKMVENLIDRLVAKSKQDELKEAMGRITGALQGTETSVGAQVAGGMLGYGEGERQLSEARAKALQELQALRLKQLEVLSGYAEGSPEHTAALAGLAEINRNIATITASQDKWRQRVEDLASSSFGDFLGDLATGAKNFKDAFADMVRSFVAGVAKMIAQELALRAIKSLMGAWGGGAVGPVVREAIPVGSHHTGGIAGRSTRRIRVSPLLFGHAPRYHSGGIAGLKPDEVPAILQTGERVLSRRQTAMYDATLAAGASAGRVTTPIVAIGDDAVANALAGAAGENVVVTHVRNNWGGLQYGN
ncbi:MAG: hypothetical protein FH747_06785 [Stenotrophomonas sp.]|uniref:phage tail length tape measure family protein n=1 Tax=Stenotrophomonas sp. TaxID=69392 RepID=UPI0013540CA4|nr:phage tail length tape measure family protein [Stenotrophomonas sp.]MTI73353.1 hypothetical protein [Stenotrophomonas sp.]